MKIPHGFWKDYSQRIPECDHDEKDHHPVLADKNVFHTNGTAQMWKCSKCKCRQTVASVLLAKWALTNPDKRLSVFYRYYPNARTFFCRIHSAIARDLRCGERKR